MRSRTVRSRPADTPEGLAEAISMGRQCADLNDYLRGFDVTLSVLQDERSLYRAAYELAEDAGLMRVARWSEWSGAAFDNSSSRHISVYAPQRRSSSTPVRP